MDQITHLVEQHIRESEAHLRHIDEVMARAQEARAKYPVRQEIEMRLTRVKSDRDRLAKELNGIRGPTTRASADAATLGERLKGDLQAVGLEIDRALAAMVELDER